MTGKKLLMISENGKGFIENSVEQTLKADGYKVYSVAYSDNEVNTYIETVDAILLVGNDLASRTLSMERIKGECETHNKKIFLHAERDNIGDMIKIFGKELLANAFIRPVDNKEMISKINQYFDDVVSYGKKNILVVDDSGVMLRTIMGWLEGDYNVTLANSAARAFAAIQNSRPDLILLDYEMPICSGAQFMEMLSNEEATRDIPVIFLTSRGDQETVNEVLRLKPAGYLLKSTPEHMVLKTIADYFDKVNRS